MLNSLILLIIFNLVKIDKVILNKELSTDFENALDDVGYNDDFFSVLGVNVKKIKDMYLIEKLECMSTELNDFLNEQLTTFLDDIKDSESIPYDDVTKIIYSCSDLDLTEFHLYRNKNNSFSNDQIEEIEKLERHIRLAFVQSKEIYRASLEAKEMSSKALDNVKKIEDIKNNIYTDFIAILGIFSALIFGMFGGFDSLKEILSNIHNTSIATTLICFSSLMLGLLCLIFLLIQSIAKITNKDTLSCNHHGSNEKCECSIIKKYPIFIFSMLIFSFILIISCVIRFFDHINLYRAIPIYWIIAGILIIIVIFILYKIGVISIVWNTTKDMCINLKKIFAKLHNK